MSRSKKNWDYLVDDLGNYDPLGTGSGGGGGGTGSKGAKGDKGDIGPEGPKGDKLEFGDLTPADKEALKGDPGADGADGVDGTDGDKGDKGDNLLETLKGEGILPPDAKGEDLVDLLKGEKGEEGAQGDKGEDGDQGAPGFGVTIIGNITGGIDPNTEPGAPVCDTEGNALIDDTTGHIWVCDGNGNWIDAGALQGPKGEKGEDGDSAYDIAVKGGFTGTETEWLESVKGEKGEDGESAYDSAVKGGFTGTETEWLEGLKGEKGDVDDLLSQVLPEAAFDVYDNSQNTVIQSGTVDFHSTDQTGDIYKRGLITLGKTVTVEHAPMEAQAFMLANYVIFDTTPEGDPKNNDYTVIQMLYNGTAVDATRNAGRDDATNAYWRRARPGRNQFTSWRSLEFDTEKYYLKSEVEDLIDEGNTTYALSAEKGAADDTASVILTDNDDVTSQVNLKVTGGLSIAVAGTDVTIDASAFSGGAIFLGPITAPEDPATLFGAGNPAVGSYYVYTNSDDSWNGEVVNAGDWAAYSASGWINLNYITSNIGVVEVQGEAPITVDTTDAARPIVGIDIDALKTDLDWDNQVSLEQLLALAETRLLGDLADVTIGYTAEHECTYNTKNDTFPTSPDTASPGGTYNVDVSAKTVYFGRTTNIGDSQTVTDLYNNTTDGQTYHTYAASDGSWTQSALVVQKQDTGDAFAYIYESPSLLAQLNGPEQEFVVGVRGASTAEDGDVLVWNEGMGQWVPGSPQDNSGNLVDKQVVYAGPDGEFLSTPKLTIEGTHVEGASDILPDADLTRSLGSADKRWKEIHAENIVIGDGETLDGTLDSVCKIDPVTDVDVTVGSLIKMDDGKDAYNGGPHELEARSGEATDWDAWIARSAAEANTWDGVTYGNGKFVAVATTGTNRVMTSVDGETWIARAHAGDGSWRAVTYGNGKFVAVGDGGTNRVMTSVDGETWTARNATEANNWYDVTYGNGKFVAVSATGTNRVMTSVDGETWTPHSAAEQNSWSSVIYGNGKFVAIATSGTNRVMTSVDGETWTPHSASENNYWQDVAFGNGKFVAIGNSGAKRVMTSVDGETWTAHDPAENSGWWSITYGNGKFVAVATTGTNRVMTSVDGETWTPHSATENNYWRSVTSSNGKFVAVSNSGSNRVMTLDAIDSGGGLYFDDELVATRQNIAPIIDAINENTQNITEIEANLESLIDGLNGNFNNIADQRGVVWVTDDVSLPAYLPSGNAIPEGKLYFNSRYLQLYIRIGGSWLGLL